MAVQQTIVPRSSTSGVPKSHRRKQTDFGYLYHVDGIRGFAIALVVLFHIFVGKVSAGVDIFLFIGGLLFVSSQMRNASSENGMSFSQSFVRLLRRLAPALLTVVGVTLLASLFLYPPAEWWRNVRDASSAVTYIINWTFGLAGESYITAGESASLYQHLWSMSVQMQIYLILMIIIYSSAAALKVATFDTNTIWRRSIYGIVAALTVLSFVYAAWMHHHNQTINYYSTFTRFWEIGVGSLLGALALSHLVFTQWIRHVLGMLGILLVLSAGVFLDGVNQFPAYWTLVPLLGALFLIVAGQTESGEQRTWGTLGVVKIFDTKPLQFLGNISYSLYLWHWSLLILALQLTKQESPSIPLGIAVLVMSVCFAWGSYVLVEKPLRQRGKPSPQNAFTLGYLRKSWRSSDTIAKPAAAVVLSVLSVLIIASPLLLLGNTKIQAYVATQAAERAGGFYNAYPGARSLLPDVEVPPNLPIQPDPNLEVTTMMPVNWEDSCYTEFGSSELVLEKEDGTGCFYGDTGAQETLYVIGGSHSEQYMNALDDIGKRRNIRVIPIIKMGCPMVNEGKWDGTDFSDCDQWAEQAMNWILDNPPTMGVFLTSTRPQTITGKGTDIVPESYKQVFQRLSDAGIHIYAVRDNPWIMQTDEFGNPTDIQKDVRLCVSGDMESQDCGVPQQNTLSVVNPAPEAYAHIPNITHMDFTPIFCQDGYCPAVIGNVLVYRDSHHLTNIFVQTMTPFIENEIFKEER